MIHAWIFLVQRITLLLDKGLTRTTTVRPRGVAGSGVLDSHFLGILTLKPIGIWNPTMHLYLVLALELAIFLAQKRKCPLCKIIFYFSNYRMNLLYMLRMWYRDTTVSVLSYCCSIACRLNQELGSAQGCAPGGEILIKLFILNHFNSSTTF